MTRVKIGLLFAVLALLTTSVQAGYTYKLTTGVGYYDDAANWGNPTSFGTDFSVTGDLRLIATNNHAYTSKTLGQFILKDSSWLQVQSGATVVVGGSGNGLFAGFTANRTSGATFEAGSVFKGTMHLGRKESSCGIVTNYATWSSTDVCYIGDKPGSTGIYVHVAGTHTSSASTSLWVGNEGRGELLVQGGTYGWANNENYAFVYIGNSSAGGLVRVESGAAFIAGYNVYLGGYAADKVGCGELILNGGNYTNSCDNGTYHKMIVHLGVAPDGAGGISPNSWGAIRGWGAFAGDSMYTRATRSICAELGYGVIEADGGGDESHVLSCGNGLYMVSNALPVSVVTESGWRAKNKGAVCFPGYQLYASGSVAVLEGCVGCATSLAKPDLVNSVRVRIERDTGSSDWCAGVMLLDSGRTDAHVDKLPTGCNVLNVHRIGTFKSAMEWTDAQKFTSAMHPATFDFRYDQTKILRDDTQLELWRYSESAGKWTRLSKLAPGARPSDCVISTPSGVSPQYDETFNYGTFAVVERPTKGLILVVR